MLRLCLLVFLFLLSPIFCSAQKNNAGKYFIDTSCVFGYEFKSAYIGFPEESVFDGEVLPDSVLRIDTISKIEFEKYAGKYSPEINRDSTVISKTDSSFTLKNPHFEKTFPAFRICECTASDYGGLISPLNLYIISSTDMQNEIAYMRLYDYKTGKPFEVPAHSDPGPQAVLISPQHHFLLSYSNSYYEHDDCAVYLMHINRNKTNKTYTIENEMAIYFDRLNIENLVWINENSFAVRVTEQMNPDDKAEKKITYYLKITIEK